MTAVRIQVENRFDNMRGEANGLERLKNELAADRKKSGGKIEEEGKALVSARI